MYGPLPPATPISERRGALQECRWLEPSHGSAQVSGRARYTYTIIVPSLLGSVIVQELAGPSPGHLHSVWRSSVADTLVWGAHEVRSGQPSRFSPLGFQHSLFPRHGLARGAHAGSAQCMAMLEPWPTVSFLSHPPARKRFPLIRPGKLSGMQASHYFASISLMTSTLVTPSELPVIRQGYFMHHVAGPYRSPWTRTVSARFVKPSRGSSTWLEIVSLPRCHHSVEARAWCATPHLRKEGELCRRTSRVPAGRTQARPWQCPGLR